MGPVETTEPMYIRSRQAQLPISLHAYVWKDAAELYEVAGLHEKAATIYISMKSFASAAPLMQKLDPERCGKLQGQYAKAKEKEGKYEDALEGYQRAGRFTFCFDPGLVNFAIAELTDEFYCTPSNNVPIFDLLQQ